MKEIVGIQFEEGGKIYFFDPQGTEYYAGDGVVVDTAKGQEYAVIAQKNTQVDSSEIVGELKPVLRLADAHDLAIVEENNAKKPGALKIFKEKIEARKLKMKAVDASFAFDGGKITFFYTAESRVDFRELVKDLASEFKRRIELRQIFERDDMKMRGTIAQCGRPCCCTLRKKHNCKATIKMAKAQGLSLVSQKVAGMCGKLMCCLSYESQTYEDIVKKMPKLKARVKTPDGQGTVEAQNILKQTLRVRVDLDGGGFAVREYPLEKLSGGKRDA